MKRSRRVVLTLMGSAAIGAVSMGFKGREPGCASGPAMASGPGGAPCVAVHGGFGRSLHLFHGNDGHGYGHAGG